MFLHLIFFLFLNFLSINLYANDEYAILVEKKSHRLTIFKYGEKNQLSFVKTYPAVTGKKSGNKIASGDMRTPEGIYLTTQTKNKEDLFKTYGKIAEKYGPKAFVLNYPNFFDTQNNKTGSGIWIHGVLSNDRVSKPFDTEGCVAINNDAVVEITNYIEHFNTPVVIVDSLADQTVNDIFGKSSKFAFWLETWRQSWESGDFAQYQEYYSDKFENNAKRKEEWVANKKELFEIANKKISIQITNPKVIELKDQLVIIFDQKYSSSLKTDEGRKALYIKKEGEEYRIVAENFYPLTDWK